MMEGTNMTGTFDGPARTPRHASGPTPAERAVVLGGFALAALCTAWSIVAGAGIETVVAAWLAAGAWAFLSSLALALRRGLRDRDWSAFRPRRSRDNGDLVDWTTRTGRYTYLRHREDRILHDDRHLR